MTAKTEAPKHHKFWAKVLNIHRQKMEETRKQWSRYVKAYRSEVYQREPVGAISGMDSGEEDITVEHNYLFAFVDSMISNICPPNPEVDVVAMRQSLRKAAKLRTRLVNDFLMRDGVAEKLWKLSARAAIYPRSFLKTVWNDRKGRPTCRVLGPQWVFFDQTAETWEDIRYVVEVTVLTRGEVEARLRKQGKKGHYRASAIEDIQYNSYPGWLKSDRSDGAGTSDEEDVAREAYEWAVVYEVYDFVGNKFYHFAEGTEHALYEGPLPYQHLRNPFQILAFNDNLEDLGGLSDAHLVYPTIERLNQLESLRMWHIKTSIPVPVVHEGLVDDPDEFMDAYEDIDGPGQAILMNARPNVGIHDVLGHTPIATLPVEWESANNKLERFVEFVLGIPAYERGAVGQSDIATELALVDTAQRTRNLRRQKALYLVVAWLAEAVISLYAQFLPPDSEIPLRLMEDEKQAAAGRDTLALPSLDADGNLPDPDPFGFDYQARPFNADEMNSVVALKKLETFLPAFQGNPSVDQHKLTKKLAELLKMPEIVTDQPPQAAPPGMAPGAPLPPEMEGTIPPEAAGAMPPEVAALQNGVVEAGTGSGGMPAQSIGGPAA